MKKLSLLLLLTLAMASCQNKYPDLEDGVYAEVVTNKGTFVAKLYNEATPLTVASFVSLAEGTNGMVDEKYKGKRFYDSLIFHRVIKDFMIQGGDPTGTGSGSPGYKFPDEIVDTLVHDKKGMLSMANSGPATNGSQFFVTLKETPWLNGKHTVFGEVVMGMDVVDSIGAVEVTPPANRPVTPVVIETINIIKKGGVKVPYFTEEMEKIETAKKEKEAAAMKVAEDVAAEIMPLKDKAETLPSGLKVYWNKRSKGQKPAEGSSVMVNYAGYFENGKMFDTNRLEVAEKFDEVNAARKAANAYVPNKMSYSPDAQLAAGFREALLMMSVGDKVTAFVPSHLGYGERGYPPVIPPNTDLVFELEITDIME
ncbi:MAG: peptidylprolyl isomerase [Patiriisocius sp.]|uniref:peptidylprolyl isomerase n=1 Tax=Patiriisocius sp. TaxID=2822396 RepID=UPI003EF34B10